MTDHPVIGEPRTAHERSLERSLREGPPDEVGYRAVALDFGTDPRVETVRTSRSSVRVDRRPPHMTPIFASLDSALVVLVVVFAGLVLLQPTIPGGVGGSPPPTEPASASPIPVPALTETFVSPRNGFSVSYPAGWTTKAAATTWLPNKLIPIGNPAVDELKLDGVARLVVASQRLQEGQTEASWIASFGQEYFLRRCSGDRATWARIIVDGRSGYLDLNGCPLSADRTFSTPDVAFGVIVFAADRVYRISLDGVVDLAYFEAILATVHLDPASAIDAPAPS